MITINKNENLAFWKERFAAAQNEYAPSLEKMDRLWKQYLGDKRLESSSDDGFFFKEKTATLVRNFTFELIESQLDNTVPMPKVSSPVKSDKKIRNARVIEAMLKSLMAKMPLERQNGEEERITKALGASFRLLGWDSTSATHTTCGEPFVRLLHPKQVVPQAGICDLSLMDYVFVLLDDTLERLSRRYGVKVEAEDGNTGVDGEIITQITAYYINKKGTLGVFSWAGNTVLEDEEEYCSRLVKVCTGCGKTLPQTTKKCICGSQKFEKNAERFEYVRREIILADGQSAFETIKVPYYTPKVFPVLIRKNVAVFGDFLGDSDCERIRDLQLAHNKLASKLQQKMLKGGSVLTLPKGVKIETSDREDKIVYLDTPAQKTMIDAISLQPGITQDYEMLLKYYADARSTLGITDSYQGKNDATAVSGAAKQFAAKQTEGRLESKVRMKKAAYAELFRAMFQYMLAYADEVRPFSGIDENTGTPTELVFSRYDFLERDENGEWYYDDDYIFDVDAAAAAVNDRQAMWAEVRTNFLNGAFGNPSDTASLLMLWKQLELLEYPNAGAVYSQLQTRAQTQTDERKEQNYDGQPTY